MLREQIRSTEFGSLNPLSQHCWQLLGLVKLLRLVDGHFWRILLSSCCARAAVRVQTAIKSDNATWERSNREREIQQTAIAKLHSLHSSFGRKFLCAARCGHAAEWEWEWESRRMRQRQDCAACGDADKVRSWPESARRRSNSASLCSFAPAAVCAAARLARRDG